MRSQLPHTLTQPPSRLVPAPPTSQVGETHFVGYGRTACAARLVALRVGGVPCERASAGADVELVLDSTPFYAEGGGQVGDQGTLALSTGAGPPVVGEGPIVRVRDVRRAAGGRLFVHRGLVEGPGELVPGCLLWAAVDEPLRRRARAHHTATHLLQAALRTVLGASVAQAGSLVGFDRLRFDFSADAPPTGAQLARVEALVNAWVGDDLPVATATLPLAQARASGAVAMFGEKYGDSVRVVDIGGVSLELCGGTHVATTAQIGGFKLLSESGIAAGVRRVEAVAGPGLVELLGARDSLVQGLAQQLRVQPDRLAARVAAMADDQRRLSAEVEQLKAALAVARCEALLPSALRLPGGALLLVRQLDGLEAAPLAAAAQHLHAQLGPGPTAVVLGSAAPDARVCLVAALSPDAVARGASAGALLAQLAKLCGGGGGGKPAFAQAGGKDAAALPAALDTAVKQLTAQLSAPAAV